VPGKCFMKYSSSSRFCIIVLSDFPRRVQSVAGSAPDRANNGSQPSV
jgi:hypothetical protein